MDKFDAPTVRQRFAFSSRTWRRLSPSVPSLTRGPANPVEECSHAEISNLKVSLSSLMWAPNLSRTTISVPLLDKYQPHAALNFLWRCQTQADTYKLSVGREVKMEIPRGLLALFREGKNRKNVSAKSDVSTFQVDASNRHGGNQLCKLLSYPLKAVPGRFETFPNPNPAPTRSW